MVFAAVLGLLAVFSIISIVTSTERDASRPTDPMDDPFLWIALGRR